MSHTTSAQNLTSSRLLAKNTLLNLLGQGTPLLAALVAIPLLIKGMGTERFGILTLTWVVIGYFSIFDLGIGRALTQLVARKLGTDQNDEIPSLIWTGLALMLVLGLIGAMAGLLLTPLLVLRLLNIPPQLQGESLSAFYLLAATIPVVIGTAGLRGILEAYQRFGVINAIRIPMGLFNFIGPLMVLPFSSSLNAIVAALAGGRVLGCLLYIFFCFRTTPALRHYIGMRREVIRPLLTFGSWITVGNIISPMMVYFDRFLIAALMSTTAVAYYATPSEMVTRLFVIPVAVLGVLFPAFATSLKQDRGRTAVLFTRGLNYIFLVMFPLILVIITFAPEGLELWLGAEFAQKSTLVLQFLAIGVFLSSLNRFPHALVQGAGRPDLTTKVHLAELVLYFPMLWWLTKDYGIIGAAAAWTMRVFVDTLLQFLLGLRFLPETGHHVKRLALITFVAMIVFAVGTQVPGGLIKVLFTVGMMLTFAGVAWFMVLVSKERELVCRWLTRFSG